MLFACVRCAVVAFVLGILGVIFLWPFLQDLWSGSYSRNNAGYARYEDRGGYQGYGDGYGRNDDYGGGSDGYGRYGGYDRGQSWGQPTYAVSAPYQRQRLAPRPRPCCDY
jgi:hypothetical protein